MPINYDRQMLAGIANRYKQLAAQLHQSQEDAVSEALALEEIIRGITDGKPVELRAFGKKVIADVSATRATALEMARKVEEYAASLGK